jgi:hypothetical protein
VRKKEDFGVSKIENKVESGVSKKLESKWNEKFQKC